MIKNHKFTNYTIPWGIKIKYTVCHISMSKLATENGLGSMEEVRTRSTYHSQPYTHHIPLHEVDKLPLKITQYMSVYLGHYTAGS